jgi:hypothetical protein
MLHIGRRIGSKRVLGVAGLSLVTFLAVVPSVASASAPSATSMLAGALKDATAARWVHEDVRVADKGVIIERAVNDVGTTEGIHVEQFGKGSTEVFAMTSKKIAYVKGNEIGLERTFKMSSSNATKYDEKWMLLRSTNALYDQAVSATTLASDFSQAQMTGTLEMSPVGTLSGVAVRSISGVIPAMNGSPKFQATIYVTATGKPLPVGLRETSGKISITVTWAKWGINPNTPTPTGVVPYPK